MSQRPRISVIVTTYNAPRQLAACLESLVENATPPLECLVADDGSGPETRACVSSWAARCPWPIHHVWHEDAGFRRAAILNRAIARATGDLIVFVDGDCLVHSRFVEDHQQLAHEGCFVQGRRAFIKEAAVPEVLEKGFSFLRFALSGRMTGILKGIRLPLPRIRIDTRLHGILGCNLAVFRSDLLRVNGFDEAYEGWGKEDSDLAARLYNLGLKRRLVHGRAIVYHLDHPLAPRDNLDENERRLATTLQSKTTRAAQGLDEWTTNAPPGKTGL